MANERKTPVYWPIWRPRPKPVVRSRRYLWSAPFFATLVAHTEDLSAPPPKVDRAALAYRRAWRLTHPEPFLGVLKPFSCNI